MANAAGDAHEYPVYGYHFRVTFPILDADGDLVTAAAGLDSEFSNDAGTFADCTNEATEIATSSGMYYLDLIGSEMDAKMVDVIVKTSTTGAKTTALSIRPRRLPALETGTAQAGAASTITLASGASAADNFYNGLFVGITNNSPAGAQYQLRRIISYVGSTRVATVDSAWGTNPSSASTYEILVPEGMSISAWAGTRLTDAATAGIPDINLKNIANAAVSTSTAQLGVNTVQAAGTAWGSGAITAASIAADAIGASELAADAVTEIVTGILTTAMTEAYAADGVAPTLAQAIFLLIAALTEFSISGTTITAKKLDGSTTAATFTINDATNPTSRTRAS